MSLKEKIKVKKRKVIKRDYLALHARNKNAHVGGAMKDEKKEASKYYCRDCDEEDYFNDDGEE